MTRVKQKVKRDDNQLCMKSGMNTRIEAEIGCPATPAPTLPVSLCDYWSSIVGAGLSDSHHHNADEKEV